jgi:hypothetical protein
MAINSFDHHRIQQGVLLLLKNDGYLLENITSERSITHKLGEHYQFIFHEWNVDCEFNRNLNNPKEIDVNPHDILRQMAHQLKYRGFSLDIFDLGDSTKVKAELRNLETQLLDERNVEYFEELGVAHFTLTLVDGRKLKKTIYPDVIIHHRGTSDNHIVIECKKSVNKDPRDRAYDLIKLITLVSSTSFMYRAGYFIDVPVGSDLANFKNFINPLEFAQDVFCIRPQY